jgi:hypothetical protein
LPVSFKRQYISKKNNLGNQKEEGSATARNLTETVILINASKEYALLTYQSQYSYKQEAHNIKTQISNVKNWLLCLSSYNFRWFLLRRSVAIP